MDVEIFGFAYPGQQVSDITILSSDWTASLLTQERMAFAVIQARDRRRRPRVLNQALHIQASRLD